MGEVDVVAVPSDGVALSEAFNDAVSEPLALGFGLGASVGVEDGDEPSVAEAPGVAGELLPVDGVASGEVGSVGVGVTLGAADDGVVSIGDGLVGACVDACGDSVAILGTCVTGTACVCAGVGVVVACFVGLADFADVAVESAVASGVASGVDFAEDVAEVAIPVTAADGSAVGPACLVCTDIADVVVACVACAPPSAMAAAAAATPTTPMELSSTPFAACVGHSISDRPLRRNARPGTIRAGRLGAFGRACRAPVRPGDGFVFVRIGLPSGRRKCNSPP